MTTNERAALTRQILDYARRLLDLGVPPEEIQLRGDGFTVTILREYPEPRGCRCPVCGTEIREGERVVFDCGAWCHDGCRP